MNDTEVKESIETAIKKLKEEKPRLNFGDIHERATAHRLAVHMEKLFLGWNIDCEYNRDKDIVKKLKDTGNTDRIFPDIIVHKRGEPINLLIIELKKNNAEDPCDHKKLTLFTSQNGKYKYQLGLYVNINGGEFECTWFKNGEKET